MFERREGEPLNLKQLWHAALGELQLGLTKANYDTWFKDTAVISEEDDVYCVGVPNAFAREWLENKYRQQVRDALRHLVGRTVDVRFVTLTAASVRSDRPVAAAGGAGSVSSSQNTAAPTQERRDATAAALHVGGWRGRMRRLTEDPFRCCQGAVNENGHGGSGAVSH